MQARDNSGTLPEARQFLSRSGHARPLTLQWKPRSVGVVSEEPMATRKFMLALKLCATLLAISMATIPVCSARCAAQACTVLLPNDGAGGCHHSSNDSDSRGMKSKTMNVSCAAGEAVFTLLRARSTRNVRCLALHAPRVAITRRVMAAARAIVR